MSLTQTDPREKLLAGDAEFQKLAKEHSSYQSQLEQLSSTPYFSSEDALLETKLKKLKLRVKDEMERRIAFVTRSVQSH